MINHNLNHTINAVASNIQQIEQINIENRRNEFISERLLTIGDFYNDHNRVMNCYLFWVTSLSLQMPPTLNETAENDGNLEEYNVIDYNHGYPMEFTQANVQNHSPKFLIAMIMNLDVELPESMIWRSIEMSGKLIDYKNRNKKKISSNFYLEMLIFFLLVEIQLKSFIANHQVTPNRQDGIAKVLIGISNILQVFPRDKENISLISIIRD